MNWKSSRSIPEINLSNSYFSLVISGQLLRHKSLNLHLVGDQTKETCAKTYNVPSFQGLGPSLLEFKNVMHCILT